MAQVRNLIQITGGYMGKEQEKFKRAKETKKIGQMADYTLAFVVTKCSLCTHQHAHEQMAH